LGSCVAFAVTHANGAPTGAMLPALNGGKNLWSRVKLESQRIQGLRKQKPPQKTHHCITVEERKVAQGTHRRKAERGILEEEGGALGGGIWTQERK